MMNITVREIEHRDVPLITAYWLSAGEDFLRGMGADIAKVPAEAEWMSMLSEQVGQPYHERKSYCMIWEVDGVPVGHSNVNKITFGKEAFMHLHMWNGENRNKGLGVRFVKLGIPHFFTNLELETLYCEPYALNPAPNKTLEAAGFFFVKQYVTTPGWINFEQPVKLWEMKREQMELIKL